LQRAARRFRAHGGPPCPRRARPVMLVERCERIAIHGFDSSHASNKQSRRRRVSSRLWRSTTRRRRRLCAMRGS